MFVFGGKTGLGKALNDVCVLRIKTAGVNVQLTWSRPRVSGSAPAARSGHSATAVGGKMYVFGGEANLGERVLGDLAIFDPNRTAWLRSSVPQSGDIPCARSGHSSCALSDSVLAILGGTDGDGAILPPHLYLLNTESMVWTCVPSGASAPPPPLFGAAAMIVQSSLVLWGGCARLQQGESKGGEEEGGAAAEVMGDVFLCDVAAAVAAATAGTPPPPPLQWSRVPEPAQSGSAVPCARVGHTCVPGGSGSGGGGGSGSVYMLGGFDGEAELGDVFTFRPLLAKQDLADMAAASGGGSGDGGAGAAGSAGAGGSMRRRSSSGSRRPSRRPSSGGGGHRRPTSTANGLAAAAAAVSGDRRRRGSGAVDDNSQLSRLVVARNIKRAAMDKQDRNAAAAKEVRFFRAKLRKLGPLFSKERTLLTMELGAARQQVGDSMSGALRAIDALNGTAQQVRAATQADQQACAARSAQSAARENEVAAVNKEIAALQQRIADSQERQRLAAERNAAARDALAPAAATAAAAKERVWGVEGEVAALRTVHQLLQQRNAEMSGSGGPDAIRAEVCRIQQAVSDSAARAQAHKQRLGVAQQTLARCDAAYDATRGEAEAACAPAVEELSVLALRIAGARCRADLALDQDKWGALLQALLDHSTGGGGGTGADEAADEAAVAAMAEDSALPASLRQLLTMPLPDAPPDLAPRQQVSIAFSPMHSAAAGGSGGATAPPPRPTAAQLPPPVERSALKAAPRMDLMSAIRGGLTLTKAEERPEQPPSSKAPAAGGGGFIDLLRDAMSGLRDELENDDSEEDEEDWDEDDF